jgi:16S rRNA (guanine527-N7)-methyltransferase
MLGLTDVECIHARAEEAARKPEHKGQYTLVTARAVARLTKLVGYALPFLKPGGLFLAMKGPGVESELREAKAALRKYGGVVEEVRAVAISEEIEHKVAVIKKVLS